MNVLCETLLRALVPPYEYAVLAATQTGWACVSRKQALSDHPQIAASATEQSQGPLRYSESSARSGLISRSPGDQPFYQNLQGPSRQCWPSKAAATETGSSLSNGSNPLDPEELTEIIRSTGPLSWPIALTLVKIVRKASGHAQDGEPERPGGARAEEQAVYPGPQKERST